MGNSWDAGAKCLVRYSYARMCVGEKGVSGYRFYFQTKSSASTLIPLFHLKLLLSSLPSFPYCRFFPFCNVLCSKLGEYSCHYSLLECSC